MEPAPPGTGCVASGAAYRSSSLPSTARARASGFCGNGSDRIRVSTELSASLATISVACSAGATCGACVGAESSPWSSRWWARSRKCHSTPPMMTEATSRTTNRMVWWRGIMAGAPPSLLAATPPAPRPVPRPRAPGSPDRPASGPCASPCAFGSAPEQLQSATAGQAMLSTAGRAVRPRVTVMPAWPSAEFSTPASDRLRVTHADCAVFQGRKRVP